MATKQYTYGEMRTRYTLHTADEVSEILERYSRRYGYCNNVKQLAEVLCIMREIEKIDEVERISREYLYN